MKRLNITFTILLYFFFLALLANLIYGQGEDMTGKTIAFILLDTSGSMVQFEKYRNLEAIKAYTIEILGKKEIDAFALLEFNNGYTSSYIHNLADKEIIKNRINGINPDKFAGENTYIYSAILDTLNKLVKTYDRNTGKQLYILTDGRCSEKYNDEIIREIKHLLQSIFCRIIPTNNEYEKDNPDFKRFIDEINQNTETDSCNYKEIQIMLPGGIDTYQPFMHNHVLYFFCIERKNEKCYIATDIFDYRPRLSGMDMHIPLRNPSFCFGNNDIFTTGEELLQEQSEGIQNTNKLYLCSLATDKLNQTNSKILSPDTVPVITVQGNKIDNIFFPIIKTVSGKGVLAYWQDGWLKLHITDSGFKAVREPYLIFLDMDGVYSPIQCLEEQGKTFFYFVDAGAIYRYYVNPQNPEQASPLRFMKPININLHSTNLDYKVIYHPVLKETICMLLSYKNQSLMFLNEDDKTTEYMLTNHPGNRNPQFDIIPYEKNSFYCAWTENKNNTCYMKYCLLIRQQDQYGFTINDLISFPVYNGQILQPKLWNIENKVLLFFLSNHKSPFRLYYKELN